jgi:predicted CoA-binding protein
MDWRKNLVTDDAEIFELCRGMRRVAVLGIKPESHADQPAHYVPAYLKQAGVEVVPVPVYYPEVTEILGAKVVRRVVDIEGPIDALDVFRRPQDLMGHLDDVSSAKPPLVWLQLGIAHDAFAQALAERGIRVVQNRCLMVDHRRVRAQR